MSGAPKWTHVEKEFLIDNYGKYSPAQLAKKLFELTGICRSKNAVVITAGRMGLDHRRVTEAITIQDAAELSNTTVHIVRHAIKQGVIKPKKTTGRCVLLDVSELDKLEAKYPSVPPGYTMTKQQLMAKLGYGETQATRLLKGGVIRGIKRGDRWHVDANHVEEWVQKMREEGLTRLDLSGFQTSYLQSEREKMRAYALKERKKRRRKDRRTTFCTQSEAAKLLNLSLKQTKTLLQSGVLEGKQENGLWLAKRKAVRKYGRKLG
ncbi:MAG: hypothetical protein IV090_19880 [Candidatus Sericytochromatia bacterium]|nr:hypothetical protein [Candidatus Sericytochromatia bacterium]